MVAAVVGGRSLVPHSPRPAAAPPELTVPPQLPCPLRHSLCSEPLSAPAPQPSITPNKVPFSLHKRSDNVQTSRSSDIFQMFSRKPLLREYPHGKNVSLSLSTGQMRHFVKVVNVHMTNFVG